MWHMAPGLQSWCPPAFFEVILGDFHGHIIFPIPCPLSPWPLHYDFVSTPTSTTTPCYGHTLDITEYYPTLTTSCTFSFLSLLLLGQLFFPSTRNSGALILNFPCPSSSHPHFHPYTTTWIPEPFIHTATNSLAQFLPSYSPGKYYLQCSHQLNICTSELKMVKEKYSTAIGLVPLEMHVISAPTWSQYCQGNPTAPKSIHSTTFPDSWSCIPPQLLVHDFTKFTFTLRVEATKRNFTSIPPEVYQSIYFLLDPYIF